MPAIHVTPDGTTATLNGNKLVHTEYDDETLELIAEFEDGTTKKFFDVNSWNYKLLRRCEAA